MERVREGMREDELEGAVESLESLPLLALEANRRVVKVGAGDEDSERSRAAGNVCSAGIKRDVALIARARNSVAVDVDIRRCNIPGVECVA